VAAGAEIDRVVPGDENALIRAAEGGHLEVVRFLLDQGADVNMSVRANGEDRTPLRMALRGDHDDVADLLRSRGAVR
jgi:ankyrin repeat protein